MQELDVGPWSGPFLLVNDLFQSVASAMSFLSSKMVKKTHMFGSTIEDIVKVQETGLVPILLSTVTSLVSRPENIVTQGIYRQNGNMATIQGLK